MRQSPYHFVSDLNFASSRKDHRREHRVRTRSDHRVRTDLAYNITLPCTVSSASEWLPYKLDAAILASGNASLANRKTPRPSPYCWAEVPVTDRDRLRRRQVWILLAPGQQRLCVAAIAQIEDDVFG